MEKSRILEERIKRVSTLFKELGYKLIDEQRISEAYTCEVENEKNFIGSVLIENESKFVEISYSFSFARIMYNILKSNLENLMKICYEFGCYYNFLKTKHDITFTIFSKEYYTGLNYYSLRDNIRDFKKCTIMVSNLIDSDIYNNSARGGFDENT